MNTKLIILFLLPVGLTLQAQGQYSLNWSTIDGGGGTSTGGVYSVSGTIGQPDAGTLSGTNANGQTFTLVGGFWGAVAVQTPGAPTLHLTNAAPGSVTLWWTPPTPGYVLQETPRLTPATWTNAPSGTNNPVTVPAGQPARFYRLQKP